MAPRKLINAQESIQRFIFEARKCAEQELGFAALLTVFPIILAVLEAVVRAKRRIQESKHIPEKDVLSVFMPSIHDRRSWLFTPNSLSDTDLATKLIDIRDSLVHQISLPPDVFLTNTALELQDQWKNGKFDISK